MSNNNIAKLFLEELESEEQATRNCLERIPESLFDWKPHDKSMLMGYLAFLVADIPKWIDVAVCVGEINFDTWEKYSKENFKDLIKYFNKNMEGAKNSLKNISNEDLEDMFYLRSGSEELMKSSKKDTVSQSLRHLAHHRGQLTVYMRLNDIPVPAIYGPSADEKGFNS